MLVTTVLVDEIRLALQFPRKCMDWGGEACGKQSMKKLEKFRNFNVEIEVWEWRI